MRKTSIAAFTATRVVLAGNGIGTFSSGGECSQTSDVMNAFPLSERGVRSSSPFMENNTAIYDSYQSFTYMQPQDINIEKMPAPEAKYYQHHTKRPWDVSSTELTEIVSRRKFVQACGYGVITIFLYFIMPKEKSFSGSRGSDGSWIMLPKNQPEKF